MLKKISETKKFFILIILFSFLPLISILINSSFPHTHDGLVHLARMGAYYKALCDFQIPVRWAGDLNYGYGMPLFNFMYQIPYLVSSVFILIGSSLATSFKLTLSLSFLLSGIFMFAFAKAFFKDNKKAFLVAIFYQFSSFRLVELLVRGSFGEVYTYAFLPLALFGLTLFSRQKTYRNFLLTSIATFLLILSHNSISLVFFMVAVLFVIFLFKRKQILINLMPLFFGLLLASFYWIPAMLEHKYTYGDLFMKNLYASHFPDFWKFIVPNLTNSPNLWVGGVAIQFGIFHVIAILLSIYLFLFKKKLINKNLFYYSIFLIFIALFIMNPISSFIWKSISFLRQFQFPWRFLSVVSFVTSLLAVNFLAIRVFKKNLWYYLLIFLIVISTIFYWYPANGFIKVNEGYYWNFPLNTTYFGETDVIWSEGPAKSYPKNRVDLIGGKGQISNFVKKSNLQTFDVNAQTKIQLVDHTQYFPGWRVYVDNKPVPIQFQDQNWRGEITFYVPEGKHNVKVSFEESKVRFIADLISISSFLLLMFYGIYQLKRKK